MRIMFIGQQHRLNDPRLYYREMYEIKRVCSEAEICFLTTSAEFAAAVPSGTPLVDHVVSPEAGGSRDLSPGCLGGTLWPRRLRALRWIVAQGREIAPDVVQASDTRELLPALCLKLATGCRLVFDAHEDFFNQIWEYSGKTVKGLIVALWHEGVELVALRSFDAVFCADEFVLAKYSSPRYGCRHVGLLRNFANADLVHHRPAPKPTSHLRLVYAGSVNRYRGVAECADHVNRFNEKHGPAKTIDLTVFSDCDPITSDLALNKWVTWRPYVDYPLLMKELPQYDIGVCLWLRIKKFERNLPIKNFEYMATGLPVITSNFGNLREYIDDARSGFCIDPTSYGDFERAILQLFDTSTRAKLGCNGSSFTRSRAGFAEEARVYVNTVIRLGQVLSAKTGRQEK